MENITKDDLRQFRMVLLNDLEKIIDQRLKVIPVNNSQEWLRSKAIRQILNISPGTLQNLRVTRKVRFRKVMGSYYYNRVDILKLFGDGK